MAAPPCPAPQGREGIMAARAAVWNARWALVYSLGGWTALGGMIHYSYSSDGAGDGTGPGGLA